MLTVNADFDKSDQTEIDEFYSVGFAETTDAKQSGAEGFAQAWPRFHPGIRFPGHFRAARNRVLLPTAPSAQPT